MKKLLRKVFNATGFDIVRIKNQHNSLEQHIQQVFNEKKIDCVIDVGANSGQFGNFLRNIVYDGWIVSFEPVKSVFEMLVATSQNDEKWLCYQFALGDKKENKSLNVYSSTVFSSFLEANDYSKEIWESLKTVEQEEVVVVKLDDILSDIVIKTGARRFYLKMDTQGYDLNVFRGAVNSLDMITAIQSELSLIHVYKDMNKIYDVLNEFHDYGYFISGMYPINRDKSLAVIEYDCILVKYLAQDDDN